MSRRWDSEIAWEPLGDFSSVTRPGVLHAQEHLGISLIYVGWNIYWCPEDGRIFRSTVEGWFEGHGVRKEKNDEQKNAP